MNTSGMKGCGPRYLHYSHHLFVGYKVWLFFSLSCFYFIFFLSLRYLSLITVYFNGEIWSAEEKPFLLLAE